MKTALAGRIARHASLLLATVLLGGFLSAVLVRFAPGFDVDESQLDPHLSSDTIQAIRESRTVQGGVFHIYSNWLRGALRGDLGSSMSLGRPVAELIRQRAPLTARLVGIAVLLSWVAALGIALIAAFLKYPACDTLITVLSGGLLCLPAAVLALLAVVWNLPGALVIAMIVAPRDFRYARNLLARAYRQPHIVTARAKGLSEIRILLWHVLPLAGPQLLAIAGVSVTLALGAAVPVEAVCGLAGIGQLAWQAALARDLPLLMNLTILVTLVTLLANSGADVIGHMFGGQRA
jgi:peptide/nickel transport system permease protein